MLLLLKSVGEVLWP